LTRLVVFLDIYSDPYACYSRSYYALFNVTSVILLTMT